MNELTFIPDVDVPAQLARVIARKLDSSAQARNVLAFAAAVAINAAVLATLQWSAGEARYTPAGEVIITQLEAPVELRVAQN